QACLDSMKPRPPLVSLRGALGAAWLADPAVTVERMLQEGAQQLTQLKAESARLWVEVDEPRRARAVEKAQGVQDEATSPPMLRELSAAKSTFHAAQKELENSLEKDAGRAGEGRLARLAEPDECDDRVTDEEEEEGVIAFDPGGVSKTSQEWGFRSAVGKRSS